MTIANDNNPKSRAGALKVPLEYVPTVAEAYIALVLEGGAKKYGPFNWRKEAISISTYVGAIRRHVGALMDGEDIDPESGLPHWAHIAASCAIALDALAVGKLVDDRPVRGSAPEVLKAEHGKRSWGPPGNGGESWRKWKEARDKMDAQPVPTDRPENAPGRLPYPIQTRSPEVIEAYIRYLNTPLDDCPPRYKSEDQESYLLRAFGSDEE